MKLSLESMSLKDLKDLQKQVAQAISSFEDRKRQEAVNLLEEKARELGFSLPELLGGSGPRKRRAAKAKYANPANSGETWTGRGRRPRWIEAALKAGKRLEDMLI